MEVLGVLEKRIVALVELINKLRQEVCIVSQERSKLREQLDSMEHMLLSRDQASHQKDQELILTKKSIDEMVQTIDLILEKELKNNGDTSCGSRQ